MNNAREGQDDQSSDVLSYRLCPHCLRAIPTSSGERFCSNDGFQLLEGCPTCGAAIPSPYARHCVQCGRRLMGPEQGQV